MSQSYFSFKIFVISFMVGLFFIYVLGPELKEVYIYPSPESIENILFKDKADNCFRFEEKTIQCPENTSLISTIPIQ